MADDLSDTASAAALGKAERAEAEAEIARKEAVLERETAKLQRLQRETTSMELELEDARRDLAVEAPDDDS